MDPLPGHVVVVGAGLAGLGTVTALRGQGYQGRLTLVGAEEHLPYDRPPLSKALLLGEVDEVTLDADWDDLGVELRLGCRATALHPGVIDTTAGPVGFDALVLATGAHPVTLPGDAQVLRTVEDARRLRSALVPGRRVVVVGAGWIGAEVATAGARAGAAVTVVEAGPAPLAGALPPEVGERTVPWYAAAGVELRTQARVEGIEPGAVRLADGRRLPADTVLLGLGVRPDTGWLAGATGLRRDAAGAVRVDAELRAGLPGVFAVGDCAAWYSDRYGAHLRVEHWDNALHAPAVAAANLLGGRRRYDPVPYFWSEQFGRMVQYAGRHAGADHQIWRGEPAGRSWSLCWLRGDRLVALLTVDRPRDLVQGRKLLAAGGRPATGTATGTGTAGGTAGGTEPRLDRARLADPGVPLTAAWTPE